MGMKQSNPQRIYALTRRANFLGNLLRQNRLDEKEADARARELEALQWAIPILDRHAKEAFEAQQKLEQEGRNSEAQSG